MLGASYMMASKLLSMEEDGKTYRKNYHSQYKIRVWKCSDLKSRQWEILRSVTEWTIKATSDMEDYCRTSDVIVLVIKLRCFPVVSYRALSLGCSPHQGTWRVIRRIQSHPSLLPPVWSSDQYILTFALGKNKWVSTAAPHSTYNNTRPL